MFNKRALRAIKIASPTNLEKLFEGKDENDAVIVFNKVTADHKRLLVIDTYFKNGRHIRSFNHKTSHKFEYVNLVNEKNWSTTTLLWYKTDNTTNQNRAFALMELYYFYYNSEKVIINKGDAINYFNLNSSISDELLLRNIDQIQIDNRPIKISSAEKLVNKIPYDKLSPAQKKWMEEKFYEDTAKKPYRKTFHYYFFQKVENSLIIRHFIGSKKDDYLCECFREVYRTGMNTAYFEYVSAYGAPYAWHRGCIPRNWGYKLPGLVYPKNLSKVLESFGEFRYAPLKYMADNEIPSKWDKFILGYLRTPELEQIVKEGLYSIVNDICLHYWRPPINSGGKSAAEILNIPKGYVRFLKSRYATLESRDFIQYVLENNIKISDEDLQTLIDIASLGRSKFKDLFKIAELVPPTFHKVLKYIKKQSKGRRSLEDNISLYIDYIEGAFKLGMDLKNKRFYFPQFIKKAHDNVKNTLKEKEEEINIENYKKFYNELKTLDNKEIGNYIFRFPSSKADFVEQGNKLSQCVGSMGYYGKMADRYAVLVFLYDKNTNESLYTLDIRDGNIREFRGKGNKQAPQDAVYAAKHFIRLLNQKFVFGAKIQLKSVESKTAEEKLLTA